MVHRPLKKAKEYESPAAPTPSVIPESVTAAPAASAQSPHSPALQAHRISMDPQPIPAASQHQGLPAKELRSAQTSPAFPRSSSAFPISSSAMRIRRSALPRSTRPYIHAFHPLHENTDVAGDFSSHMRGFVKSCESYSTPSGNNPVVTHITGIRLYVSLRAKNNDGSGVQILFNNWFSAASSKADRDARVRFRQALSKQVDQVLGVSLT